MRKLYVMQNVPAQGFIDILPGWDIVFASCDNLNHEEYVVEMQGADVIGSIVGLPLPRAIMEKVPTLKMVANYGAGYDNVDLDYLNEKGVLLTNSPSPVTEPTAELAMALMVCTARQVAYYNARLRQSQPLEWGIMKNLSTTLYGKTLGIIGMGKIGKAIARRGLAFGMKIIYHNRRELTSAEAAQYGAQYRTLDDLLKESDFVSLSTPLTAETHHLICNKQFEMMKRSAILINTARGSVVDEKALIEALQNNVIAGAGLDVYENEPFISPELLKMEQVVLMPHLGSATIETRCEMSYAVAQNILSAFDGQMPENMVNGDIWERFVDRLE